MQPTCAQFIPLRDIYIRNRITSNNERNAIVTFLENRGLNFFFFYVVPRREMHSLWMKIHKNTSKL